MSHHGHRFLQTQLVEVFAEGNAEGPAEAGAEPALAQPEVRGQALHGERLGKGAGVVAVNALEQFAVRLP